VPYRYHKSFEGGVIKEGKVTRTNTSYFVRDLELERPTNLDLSLLNEKMRQADKIIDTPLDRVASVSCKAGDVLQEAFDLLREDEFALLESA